MTDFPVPEGIPTHVTLGELRLLQNYAHEAGTVLEIGTMYGFTCIGMALAGAFVTSVDPHNQSDTQQINSLLPFMENLARHGFGADSAMVNVVPERIEDAVKHEWFDVKWGMTFIDGDHIWPAPMRDARIALTHLRAPGYVAFHDVTPNWPGVWRTVRELTASGELMQVAQERFLRVYQAVAYAQSNASGVSGKSSTPMVAE